jgi:predicted 3-demethylubiquinone-9 3-methyltransferase (glyoxalase superfamily)
MQKIIPHLWFDKEAKEATAFYATLFPNSSVDSVNTIIGTPSGDTDIISFTLSGQKFMAISAGPYFKLNPAISLFVTFETEAEIDAVWDRLKDGAKIMMEYQKYPWATKYGWLEDRFGVSWQLSMSENHQMGQKITPMLMFTQSVAGKAKEAIEMYTSIFPGSSTEMTVPYEKGEGDVEGYLKHSRFTLLDTNFMAMDSSAPHQFTFNEAVSFIVKCDTQEELDEYWAKLSAVPESEQCGWCKDKFGVSWQIVPSIMDEMMSCGDQEKTARVTQAFLKMKKFDIATLQKAFDGE